jgi:hypothetical protein
MGRQTKMWLTRYYVMAKGVLYAYGGKSDKIPKCKWSRDELCRDHLFERSFYRQS